MARGRIATLALALLALSLPALAADVTIEALLREMVDMERLATPPAVGYDNDQQSSYDRASTAPDKDGWFANGDAGQFIRQETTDGRTEFVMSEMTGPGAIVRLWSANPDGGGTIRIYLDGSTEPALEQDFLALTTAAVAEFPGPFSGRRSMGANLYFPIPYQESCKVTVSSPGLYYHVGYRTYPAGTTVEEFTMERARELRPVIDEVGKTLSDGLTPEGTTVTESASRVATADPWTYRLTGPAAVTRLEIRPTNPKAVFTAESATGSAVGLSRRVRQALRSAVISIRWDDEETPSVECPLGDFFGTTPGLNPFDTLAVGATREGTLYANWFMPFEKSAEISIRNTSSLPFSFECSLTSKPIEWPSEGLLRFHAKWRCEHLPAEPTFVDWPLLEADGPGRFVGVMLGVVNTESGWWGEGDEKIWVDGDTFPSYFGTGSEDYFGYAWCSPELFEHAYHAQPNVTGPGNFGYSSVLRLHIFDEIPFQHDYRMIIEKWASATRDYCATAWWYSPLGARDFFTPLTKEQLVVPALREPYKEKGALEGEALAYTATGGITTLQQGSWERMSGQNQIWWQGPAVGDTLTVTVPVAAAGEYELVLSHCNAVDYGIHQLSWDGQKLGGPLDCYHEGVVFTQSSLGTIRVNEAGDHTLTIECVGMNEKAVPSRMFGLDFVMLVPKGAPK